MTLLADNAEKEIAYLDWPVEQAGGDKRCFRWEQPGSNICLDFHGDPATAQLAVFSDGNHHMALKDSLELFFQKNEGLSGIFYATTPPGPIVGMLRNGGLQMGNLILSVSPHVFISPPEILDNLVADGYMAGHAPFVQNQGNVLLVQKDNPKQVSDVSDLMREDIRLFLSNPDTEKASFSAYHSTLKAMAAEQSGAEGFPDDKIARGRVVFGKRIHHREAPQAVADGSADVAVVFYHLALRYTRVFPDLFAMVPLGGSVQKPEPVPGNVVGRTHMGLVGDGGAWGRQLLSFLASKPVMDIYRYHGLLPA
jgi:hypothetical protein